MLRAQFPKEKCFFLSFENWKLKKKLLSFCIQKNEQISKFCLLTRIKKEMKGNKILHSKHFL